MMVLMGVDIKRSNAVCLVMFDTGHAINELIHTILRILDIG